jgi:hypothetical protein
MYVFALNCAIVLVLSALAVVLMLWIRRRIGTDSLRRNHEVAGFVYSVVGAIFAVTVALGADTAHDEYIQAEKVASAEAIQVANLYQLVDWFPSEDGKLVKVLLRQYASAVVEKEWERALHKEEPAAPETQAVFNELMKTVQGLQPTTIQQQTAYSEILHSLFALRDARYTRLYGKHAELPPLLWFVVILGGFITIGFTMFFSMESSKAHMVLILLVSVLIWSNVMVMSQVHHPFNGISITPPRALIEWMAHI